MAFNKKVLVVAAAGALTAATAVPALALENEFHGMFRVRGIISNWDAEAGIAPGADDVNVRRYVEQRARLLYQAKVSDDLKLVTHFEIDSRWGDASYGNARNDGGAIGADQVNLETKNVYLDFNIPATPVNAKVGIQPLTDSMKGILVNADAAGALFTSKFGQTTAAVGYFRFNDSAADVAGKDVRDFYIVDAKYTVSPKLKVGGAWYGHFSDFEVAEAIPEAQRFNTVTFNAEGNVGPAVVDGFVAYQFGNVAGRNLSAWAANLGAKVKAGPGTLKGQFLYTSGDDEQGNNTSWQSVAAANKGSENSFYPGGMHILLRDPTATAGTDRALIQHTSNYIDAAHRTDGVGQGIIAGFIGYDANITDKVFGNANVGFASTAVDSKNWVGTEINSEIGYKISPNLSASLVGAYVFLGDGGDAILGGDFANHEDPWTTRMMLNFTF